MRLIMITLTVLSLETSLKLEVKLRTVEGEGYTLEDQPLVEDGS